ncbi:hypothetical protein BC831DRAFT_451540 [Entophlyctis helioformis]|nr:hypothetical protein BC831DRAFT_451540 [Entophlyctis helioformis]
MSICLSCTRFHQLSSTFCAGGSKSIPSDANELILCAVLPATNPLPFQERAAPKTVVVMLLC